jgi:hypothetical protein
MRDQSARLLFGQREHLVDVDSRYLSVAHNNLAVNEYRLDVVADRFVDQPVRLHGIGDEMRLARVHDDRIRSLSRLE